MISAPFFVGDAIPCSGCLPRNDPPVFCELGGHGEIMIAPGRKKFGESVVCRSLPGNSRRTASNRYRMQVALGLGRNAFMFQGTEKPAPDIFLAQQKTRRHFIAFGPELIQQSANRPDQAWPVVCMTKPW